MSCKAKKKAVCSFGFFLLFCVFTLLVKFVDVKPIGPEGSYVGFAWLNGLVLCSYSGFCYEVSELLGYVALVTVAYFCARGAIQLMSRKGFKYVDRTIYILGITYAVTLFFYVFFDKVLVINYRPILMDGVLESSYPSSHTLLAFVVFRSASCIFEKKSLQKLCFVFCLLVIVFRILSGVHWITDIIGSLLLGSAVICGFKALCNALGSKVEK